MESATLCYKTVSPDYPTSCGKSLLTLAMKKAYPVDVLETPSNSNSSNNFFPNEKPPLKSILRCLECRETFQTNASLRQHYVESHTAPKQSEGGSFDCSTCNQIFPCRVSLKVHQQEHVLPNVQQFSSRSSQNPPRRLLSISYACHICDKGFTTRELLVEHANVHLFGHFCSDDTCQKLYGHRHPPNINNVTCRPPDTNPKSKTSNLSKKSNSSGNVQNPIDRDNSKVVANRGPKLPAAIKARRNSTKNEPCIVNVHGRKRFQCKVCHKLLSSKTSHTEHFRGVHTNFKPYSCQICLKSFAVKNTYRQHMAAHSLAGSRSSSNAEADNNNTTIRILQYQCSLCGEDFPSSEKLDYHSCTGPSQNRSSSNVKKGEVFRCKIFGCGKVFSRKEWRTKHYLSHGGESCYRCEICHELFVDEQFYLIHAQVHFKKSLLNCSVCNRTFPGKDLYERHSCRFAGVGSSG